MSERAMTPAFPIERLGRILEDAGFQGQFSIELEGNPRHRNSGRVAGRARLRAA